MGWISDYLADGGMHGMAAQSLYELLTTASEGHPLAEVAALMRATSPPSKDTWVQALEVVGEIFISSAADKPEPLASEAFEQLQAKHPSYLLALALILLADFDGRIDPPLPDTLRGPFRVYMNFLQAKCLVGHMLDGGGPDISGLKVEALFYLGAMFADRSRQKEVAAKPRPRNKPKEPRKYNTNLRAAFIAAMKKARLGGSTLMVFIDSVRVGSIDGGLTLEDGPEGACRYLLGADDLDEPYRVAMSTLRDWWKAAGKGELAG
ncbi:hypothetical protein [Pseudomonas sp. zfem002]|uniref:hypothetical protein n=1 Tax=Pseudomonas sp. zfem002 TaxID=3078197 RepID=UPI002929B9DE|nr:hypothetical protein [Pseudomonas sp. zfem002]MDU9391728.1 hypothetical protein [Pseudomonas sp. zfem002]